MTSREEIRRLKAENPKMTHKEAFSTAAKNVSFNKDLILRLLAQGIANLSVPWGIQIESFDMFDFFQWAHFPAIQLKGAGESCSHER